MSDGISATGSVTAGSLVTGEIETANGFAREEAPAMQARRLAGVRRRLLRSARALAAAALLALFGGLALPATAQADVLVSNLDQTSRGIGSIIGDRHLAAQSFSVPNGGGNYTLTSIEIVVAEDILIPDIHLLTVSVWSADPLGHPVSSLHTLTNPASIAADVAAMFTVPADATATLEAGNTYVVVADYHGIGFSNWDATTSDNEDETPSTTGWTIADTSLRRPRTDTSWGSRDYALFLRVNGTAGGGGTPSTTTFVSNTGETPGSRASSIQAQSFTTGSNASGYTLSEVAVQFYSGGLDSPMTFVKVKQDASGQPGDLVANLENPADFGGSSIVSFAAPASTTLAAGAVYWVVVNEGINSHQRISVRVTRSRDETLTAADPNWLIADGRRWKNNDGSSWASSSDALMLAIKGTAMPPAAPTGFTAAVGDAQVALAWAAPAADSGVTGHEFRYKTSGDYPDDWTPIPNSAPDEANEAAFTVTMLTNEAAHTFELRAVSAGGNSEAVEAMPVTPTPGICDRTQKVHEAIVEHLSEVDNCAAVTVADLAGLTTDLNMSDADIAALKAGDFAGLTGVTTLNLARNSFTTLPAGVFSGLTNLTGLNLSSNALSSLPAGVFSGLTALEGLSLNNNVLESLPGTVFSDLTALTSLRLNNNVLESLPAGLFSGLTALEDLYLDDNALNALPAGLFSGLTALLDLTLGGNPTDPLQLTVTVEKVGTGQVRAKVLEGAPFAVAIPVTLENGALAGGATALSVAAGSVEGTAVTVTRTAGTTAAVTVDVDLTPSPTLPSDHSGYEFVKATTDLPATILVEAPPSIVTNGVSVTSTPVAATDTYGAGETIEISVTFNKTVNATNATDFVLSVGGAKRALLLRGSGTATLVFGYVVQAGDTDTDGIWIGDQDRTLVGNRNGNPQNGEITNVAGVAADLTHGELGTQSGHKVDGSLTPSEVTIAADQPAFTAEIDDVTFTLTRVGRTAAALTVGVALTQNQDLLLSESLAQNVTFAAGEATATLQLPPDFFVGHTVTEETTLTATVQAGPGYVPGSPNTASTRIVVTDPAVTASIEATAYTFAEGADATVTVIVRTATGVPSPNRSIPLALTFIYTGLAGFNDIAVGNVWFEVEPSDFTPDGAEFIARKEVTLPIVDDALDEPDETLTMRLDKLLHTPFVVAPTQLDGTVCPSGCSVTVTITDNDAPDVTTQTAGGATWTLTGERTPAPGDTYTYSITLVSGAKPTNEYVGFYLPDSATNQDLLGSDHTDCAAPKQFCATFTGATGNTSVWDGTGEHDTISYLLGATSPHTATATLAIDQDTPLFTVITFGAIDKDGTPRSGGLTITVIEPGGAVPNTAPVITTTSPVETPENGTAVATLAATDADDDPITWTKTGGADTARFALTSAGVLTFGAAPDYEDPADAAANNEYVVFVTASDGTADTELELVVQVTNVDEGRSGTVSIDDTAPMVRDELTASTAGVADPDGLPDPFAPTWRWYRTPSGGAEAEISGATSATYTVVEADVGAALTAKASWTDLGGFTNALASAATAAVTPDVPAAPSNLLAAPGDMTVALSWGEPAATIARHDYRFKTDGSYPVGWTPIADSAPGGANATGITVSSLTNGLAYTFQVRAVDMDGVEGDPAESATVTPAGGICARTPQVQTAILGKISGVADCAVVTAAHLSRISELNLNSAGIGSLQSNDFAGLSSMTRLDLKSNGLAALPPGVFSGLSSLQTLDFRTNDLAALRADVFSGLSSLSSLSLWANKLTALPAGVFSGLSSLVRLYLNDNSLNELRADVFSGLSSLEQLFLSYNSLNELPEGVFSGLSSLERLELNNNDFTALPADAFAGLSSLERLQLNANSLSELPAGVFAGLSSLERLLLDRNDFTALPAGVFSGLSSLVRLYLNNNSLNELPAGVFSGLSSLTDLRLHGNDRTLPLIVSLEKVGAAGVRAVAPAGAPFALTLPVVVANGALAGGATTLAIAAGEVATEAVTVVPGNTGAVTVDLGTPLPRLPSGHQGYAITRAATGLPVTTQAATTCTLNQGDLWCGVVTVDPVAVTGLTNGHGYSHAGLAGDLTVPRGFTAGPDTYTINTVATGAFDGEQGLLFSLDSGLTAAVRSSLELHVRGDQFAFSDSADVPNVGVYFWPTSQDWSSEPSVTLTLRGLASMDATLSDLAVSDGGSDLLTFASGTTTYTAMAANDVATVTFTATKNDVGASVAYLDADGNVLADADTTEDGFQVVLAGGAHVVRVRVTAEDGTTTQTYTVTVTRPSSIVTDGVSVTSTPLAATDTYGAGETIEISVTFKETVNATTATDFVLSVDGAKRAPLLRGRGTDTLVFGYTVLAGDRDANGIWIGDQDRTLVGDRDGDPQNGAITSVRTGLAAVLAHGEVGAQSGHKVNGSLSPPAANTAPVITTTSPVAVAENGTAVATLAATDANDDPITWTKTGGADTDRFALTTAGVLTFGAAPDYEDPADVASADPANAAANNEYVVFVTASDGTADTADTELELVVRVTNVDEGQSGTVSIDDTAPMVGDELTASTAGVADPDGLPDPFAPTYKWYRTPSGGGEDGDPRGDVGDLHGGRGRRGRGARRQGELDRRSAGSRTRWRAPRPRR